MRRLMTLLAVLGCLLLSGLVAGAAYGCNDPKIAVSPQAAHAGDQVSFTIVNTDAGATYAVSLAGVQVASGEDADGGGASGAFKMPDLGDSEQAVTVSAVVTHAGNDDVHAASPWRSSRQMRYLVTATLPQAGAPPAVAGPGAGATQPPRGRQAGPAAEGTRSVGTSHPESPAAWSGSPRGRVGSARSGGGRVAARAAAGARTGSGDPGRVFPGSTPLAEGTAGARRHAGAPTGLSDLWSGFGSPRGSALTSLAGPATAPSGPGSPLGLGVALLALGAVTLGAGLFAAEARRRRRVRAHRASAG